MGERRRTWGSMVQQGVRQRSDLHRTRLLVVGLVIGLTLSGCHARPIVVLPSPPQDPLDHIAAEVMMAGASRLCATVQLYAGPRILMFGCLANIGDTTIYYHQDVKGPILIAGREWTARHGTGAATAQALRTQLNQAYGTSDDCLAPIEHSKHVGSSMRRWHASSFSVQLMEDPSADKSGTAFVLQYIKGPIACDQLHAFGIGTRPIYVGIEARGDARHRPLLP
jgi:hypothetical protein